MICMSLFQAYGDINTATLPKKSHRIHAVSIERAPLFRRGMGPENLLITDTGMFAAGFCAFMGALHCEFDVKIGGPEDWRIFWVTQ